ncbi:MAG: hypothetical protein AUK06_01195 [Parcubacteria group bacterium CG2_30_36_18]|uniref:Uncharacterized protein n=1 Tax=Candidatus Kuenenbacteria bacterium CG_4_10_14_3_um_filter_39_14 TaxID=1974614 RepID=A0A2M7MG72_9BACT|nr:MAG: hypothetical protein AUK06_01195 [Parcubacteria group bacterium CG2_30_36_18]PIX92089.1 MAG: hypothetical protein COZ26_03675 [Candidatus Kuenenbacteria bacterium CG_4_10_14_3_um_filter_39_14]
MLRLDLNRFPQQILNNVNDKGGISLRDIFAKGAIPPPTSAARNIKKIDLYDFEISFSFVILFQ